MQRTRPSLALVTLALAATLAGCGGESTVVAPIRLDLTRCLVPEPESGGRGVCASALQQRITDGLIACLALSLGDDAQPALPFALRGDRLEALEQREIELPAGTDLQFKLFVLQPGEAAAACAGYVLTTPCSRDRPESPPSCLLALARKQTRVSGDTPVVITYGSEAHPCGVECNDSCTASDPGCTRICWASAQEAAELCNGRDDDCDGEVDEGFDIGASCTAPGRCGAGVWECACSVERCPDGGEPRWAERVCSTAPGGSADASGTELCNGADDDCDGEIDEDFAIDDGEGGRLQIGEPCLAPGVCGLGRVECRAGDALQQSAVCSTAPGGSGYDAVQQGQDAGGVEAQCDGEDDDCDGATDEGWGLGEPCPGVGGPGSPCGAGVWECARDGLDRVCSTHPGGSQEASLPEVCNDRDDDCDNEVDEGLDKGGSCLLPGICGDGTQRCAADGRLECSSIDLAQPETCNNIDDDCDNQVDEDWPQKGQPCQHAGECGNGRFVCNRQHDGVCCSADPECTGVPAGTEFCDGIDNDCDGETDEGFLLGQPCPGTGGNGSPCVSGVWECNLDSGEGRCSTHPGGSDDRSSAETCNGLDDDCDGTVDDNPQMPLASLQYGVCQGLRQVCVQGQPSDPDYALAPGFEDPEVSCDGRDNDCDNEVDRNAQGERLRRACYSGPVPTRGVGECHDGTQVCEGGGWQVCAGDRLPVAESCNGLDDDCDGSADEDWPELGTPCFGEGACSGTPGRMVCNTAGVLDGDTCCNVDPACTGLEPDEELCDGVDNDCDGEVDEEFQLGQACPATGGAGSPCVAGVWECDPLTLDRRCSTAPGSSDDRSVQETCNGADDDCDGVVDDEPLLPPADRHVGVCQGMTKVCVGGQEQEPNYAGIEGYQAVEDLCDGRDNDCDGLRDEGADGLPLTRPCYSGAVDHLERGVCRYGTQTCEGGGWGTCRDEVAPSAEVCNGEDDDCDGQVDEDAAGNPLTQACYEGPAGTRHVGTCRDGQQTCVDGGWGVCTGQGLPTDEICDGEDDDCDGSTDEQEAGGALERSCYTGPPETRQVGGCRDGYQVCANGDWGRCLDETLPRQETCNGVDDDCDGSTDTDEFGELLTLECYDGPGGTADVGLCHAGLRTCRQGGWSLCEGQVLPVDEACDGQDNDCDGAVDEDAAGAPLVQSCYTGPANTAGRGICLAGSQTCDTGGWGPCAGEVLPRDREYCNGEDDDCDGSLDEGYGLENACLIDEGPCGQGVLECACANPDAACGTLGEDPRWAQSICSTAAGGTAFIGQEVGCGAIVDGDTSVGWQALSLVYPSCDSRITWTGPEGLFFFRSAQDQTVTVRIDSLATADMDLMVLSNVCRGLSCEHISQNAQRNQLWDEVTFSAEADAVYYIVIDGYQGASGAFHLTVACSP